MRGGDQLAFRPAIFSKNNPSETVCFLIFCHFVPYFGPVSLQYGGMFYKLLLYFLTMKKMKRIFLILFLSVFALPLNSWVFLKDVAKPKDDSSPYLIYNVMQGKPVRVCVDFIETYYDASARKLKKSYMPSGRKRDDYYSRLSHITNAVCSDWINNVKTNIEKSARTNEFQDIMRYLNSPKITYVNHGSSFKNCDEFPGDNSVFDLRLMAETNEDANSFIAVKNGHLAYASGSIRKHIMIFFHPDYINENWIDIYASKHDDFMDYEVQSKAFNILFQPTLLHEIGHILGLADQYLGTEDQGDESYTLAGIVPVNSLKSVMNSRRRGEKSMLTCDDAEGIINLIDFYSKDASSKRRTSGWASLCRNDVVYVESIPYKVTPEEYKVQLSYAAGGYEGEVPAHVKRIKAQMRAKAEQEEAAAAKAAEEESRTKAEYVRQMVQREMDYNKRLETVGYCPICHESLASEFVKVVSAPKTKITVNGQFVRYEYPYGKCSIKFHAKCWREYKATGMKVPWKTWCSKSK